MNDWIGRSQTTDDVVGLNAARRMAALLDQSSMPLANHDSIPGHWYQILFSPTDAQSTLAADGHPAKGEFLPPVALPRRMAAGRNTRFLAPFTIGEAVTRTSHILSITPKRGRTGDMCFVTVRHHITDGSGQPLLEEDQNIVYREAVKKQPSAAPEPALPDAPLPPCDLEESITFDEALLFRYSAITFNTHRIHYDQPYAREVEGYAGLVVNGSLTTMKLWDLVVRRKGRALAASRARNLAPLIAGRAVTLCAAMTGPDQVLAWALDETGQVAARVELELEAAA